MQLEDDAHNSRVHNPHDAFFKEIMGNKEAAGDFFRNYLPSEILKLVDMNTLQMKKDSFIEKELKRFYSDLLYQVSLKSSKAYFYLLFEHQSSPDRLIAFRLLRYIVKIWELELKQQPELRLLPPVIPMVLYHGEDRWNTGDRFTDIIYLGDREELRVYLPDVTYSLYSNSRRVRSATNIRYLLMTFRKHFKGTSMDKMVEGEPVELFYFLISY